MKLALTFDDGPNVPYTAQLLAVLKKHSVRATFFMIGQRVKELPSVARRVAKDGHWIGNHTMTHPMLDQITAEDVEAEIANCDDVLTKIVGKHSDMFRPPFLISSPGIEGIVSGYDLKTVLCKASGGDAQQRGAEFIYEKVQKELNGEDGVILLHDGCHERVGESRADSVKAADYIIMGYKAQGAEFVSPLEFL